MLDVALLSSRPNFPFLLLNCTEVVPSIHVLEHTGAQGLIRGRRAKPQTEEWEVRMP